MGKELTSEALSQEARMKYLLATLLLYFLAADISAWIAGEFSVLSGFRTVFSLGVVVTEILACFGANRRGDNREFLDRVICLAWPTTIRVAVGTILSSFTK